MSDTISHPSQFGESILNQGLLCSNLHFLTNFQSAFYKQTVQTLIRRCGTLFGYALADDVQQKAR